MLGVDTRTNVMEYKIWFEAFGRKLKTTIVASSKEEAIFKLREEIKVLRVEEVGDDTLDFLKKTFGMT